MNVRKQLFVLSLRGNASLMKTGRLPVLLLALTLFAYGEDDSRQHTYPWGQVRLVLHGMESGRTPRTPFLVFTQDVLADLRYYDGRQFLTAAGRLELDTTTGDFKASDWPFLHARQGAKTLHFAATDPASLIQMSSVKLKTTGTSRSYIGGEPTIRRLRRKQLSKLEKGR